jgi:outer membrane murein-binding lipoprotein Lpp
MKNKLFISAVCLCAFAVAGAAERQFPDRGALRDELISAVREGNSAGVASLLSKGADPNAVDWRRRVTKA